MVVKSEKRIVKNNSLHTKVTAIFYHLDRTQHYFVGVIPEKAQTSDKAGKIQRNKNATKLDSLEAKGIGL